MIIRRRVPTIFNVYMVDVLCCALGCVIMLWLVKSYYAEQEAKASVEKGSALEKTRNELDQSNKDLARLRQELKTTEQLLDNSKGEHKVTKDILSAKLKILKEIRAELKKVTDKFAKTDKELKGTNIKLVDVQKILEGKKRLVVVLGNQVEALEKQNKDTKKTLKDKDLKLLAATVKAEDLSDKLVNSKKVAADLEKLVALLRKDLADQQTDNKTLTAKLTNNIEKKDKTLKEKEKSLEELTKELNNLLKKYNSVQVDLALAVKDARTKQKAVTGLRATNLELLKKAKYLQFAADNRFAGISLAGKKVILLVDTSRSMQMADAKTDDPDKWPWICENLGKVLKSMPNVTHFQVIAFSEDVSYPLGGNGMWLKYDPQSSADFMVRQLKAIKPSGGTKMTRAFSEAFRYKIAGLDTIYLISDGLPNDDDNLPEEAKKLTGVERTTYLSNRVRELLKTFWNVPVNGEPPVRINALGFFFESPEVGSFLWALARENNGNFVGMSREKGGK